MLTSRTKAERETIVLSRSWKTLLVQHMDCDEHANTASDTYLFKAHALLGLMSQRLIHGATSNDHQQLLAVFASFRLAISSRLSTPHDTTQAEKNKAVWLHFLLDTMTILLYHHRNPSPEANSNHNSRQPETITSMLAPDNTRHCIAAASQIVQLIKDTVALSPNHIMNCYLAPLLYLSGQVLRREW